MLLAVASRTRLEQARGGLVGGGGGAGALSHKGGKTWEGEPKGGITEVRWVGQIGEGKDGGRG